MFTRILLLITVVSGSQVLARSADESTTMLLQQATYAEEMVGDLSQAIAIYQRIVLDSQADRKLLAEAQYRLGICYLKQGRKEQAIAVFKELQELFRSSKLLPRRVVES